MKVLMFGSKKSSQKLVDTKRRSSIAIISPSAKTTFQVNGDPPIFLKETQPQVSPSLLDSQHDGLSACQIQQLWFGHLRNRRQHSAKLQRGSAVATTTAAWSSGHRCNKQVSQPISTCEHAAVSSGFLITRLYNAASRLSRQAV